MTVPYNRDVASASSWSSIRLLLRWRGSIWKSVLPELALWLLLYYFIFTVCYCYGYSNYKLFAIASQLGYENITIPDKDNYNIVNDNFVISLCRSYASDYSVPLVMLLSFFSVKAFDRWQTIFNNIAYAENLALTVNTFINGSDRVAQLARQSVMRYAILAQILVFRDVSISVRKRFPTMHSLIEAGMLKPDELRLLENSYNPFNVFSIPFCWIGTLLTKLRRTEMIRGEPTYVNLFTEVKDFRKKLETVYNYDCVPIPLAYPQIVSVAVRAHCVVMIIGKLFVFSKTEAFWKLNYNFAYVNGLEFLVFLGWLKVAEILANPLGEDDDDLELNHIIDRNTFLSRSIIDTHDHCPILEETEGNPLPMYDEHAQEMGGDKHRLEGSAVRAKVDKGRMVEVEPTRPELNRRECWKSIANLLASDQKKDNKDNTSFLSFINHCELGSSATLRGMPSLYDDRTLRELTEEEVETRQSDLRRNMPSVSLLDLRSPAPLNVRNLMRETSVLSDTQSHF